MSEIIRVFLGTVKIIVALKKTDHSIEKNLFYIIVFSYLPVVKCGNANTADPVPMTAMPQAM